jgi:hypothetical protein
VHTSSFADRWLEVGKQNFASLNMRGSLIELARVHVTRVLDVCMNRPELSVLTSMVWLF